MRNEICNALLKHSEKSEFIFLTGDLGFMALEPLKEAIGDRFINTGISEQNMISVSAALAKEGIQVFVYSIAPFIYARAFEQIRNDIVFHNLPVNLIGNGGGYGYGVMGPTHHAIEDYGSLSMLQNIEIYLPAFNKDISEVVNQASESMFPTYIRLGKSESCDENLIPDFSSWRQILKGNGPVVIVVGALAGLYIDKFNQLPDSSKPNFWVISNFSPISFSIPNELMSQINNSKKVVFIEEHVSQGSIGLAFLFKLQEASISVKTFKHHTAKKHQFEKYGSQKYLRKLTKLDLESVIETLGSI